MLGSALAESETQTPESYLAQTIPTLNNINTTEFTELLKNEPELRVIDVRMANEIALLGGTIDAGLHPLNINRGWLEFRISDAVPDPNTPIVVFCGINQRSPLAART